MMDAMSPYRLARRVGDVLEGCGAPWGVVGSLASSVHGQPRSTHDVDLVAGLDVFDRDALVGGLAPMGYVDADAVARAIERGTSFNFIDDATCEKVDVFCVRGAQAGQLLRLRPIQLLDDLIVPVLSPEDTVAQKLRWFELGQRTSERQWRDVVEVLRVQGDRLDLALLDRLVAEVGAVGLLREAQAAAHRPR